MYGAILGDMIGAPYEFDRGGKTKDFPLFSEASAYTDDTVMTIAVAEALMNSTDQADEAIRNLCTRDIKKNESGSNSRRQIETEIGVFRLDIPDLFTAGRWRVCTRDPGERGRN